MQQNEQKTAFISYSFADAIHLFHHKGKFGSIKILTTIDAKGEKLMDPTTGNRAQWQRPDIKHITGLDD